MALELQKIPEMLGKYFLIALLSIPVVGNAQEVLFDPESGYRISAYRAPVPDQAPGARTADTGEAARLHAAGAIFVDVYPLKSYDILPDGRFAPAPPHDTIAAAVWLPIVGPGHIEPRAEAYLAAALAELTGGDKAREIVVFCLADCWMSWNASQRIARLGYTAVYWYSAGADGWKSAGNDLVRVEPFPMRSGLEK